MARAFADGGLDFKLPVCDCCEGGNGVPLALLTLGPRELRGRLRCCDADAGVVVSPSSSLARLLLGGPGDAIALRDEMGYKMRRRDCKRLRANALAACDVERR